MVIKKVKKWLQYSNWNKQSGMDYFFGKHIAYHIMAKPVGARCNLNCKYCYYLEKKNLYKANSIPLMPKTVLENFIKQYIQSQSAPVISFVWQGGEPMLAGLEFFQIAVEYQKYYAAGRRIMNAFQTNGTLINDNWCKFFKQNNFLIGISIDGPEEIHDYYRLNLHGENTWKKVMKGIKLLQDYQIDFNTLTVINNHNANYPQEVYSFLKSIGSNYHQYIPIVEQSVTGENNYPLSLVSPTFEGRTKITEWSVSPEQYADFYIQIFNQWVRNDVGSLFVQMFDVMLANWIGEPCGLCVFDQTCGNASVIEHNGDLFSCDHFVYPENFLGNIRDKSIIEMMLSKKQQSFGTDKRDRLPDFCLNCEFLHICNGGCPKSRITVTPGGEKGLNHLCRGLKTLFKHVTPYMNYMANELKYQRAPANVMAWAKKKMP
jgi:uncharacterized protein